MVGGPFTSELAFREAFEGGLLRLLEDASLGAFILVCANASFDPRLLDRALPRLQASFARLSEAVRQDLREGRALVDAEDDVLVFLKLMAVGFDHARATEVRALGPWEVQFNPLRAFRPPRAAAVVPKGIRAEFNHHGFHFNRRFLQREVFWSGTLAGRAVTLLYNKYPFVDLHGLLVPDPAAHRPQFLTREDHLYVWRLLEDLAGGLPGVGIGYNAYGAMASVNHLHFQTFVRERDLPVASPRWAHNGGTDPYPAHCEAYRDAGAAWERVAALHREESPYNLVYLPGRVYCLPRLRQGTYPPPAWTGGFAWYEMAGGVTVFTRRDLAALEADAIARELARIGGALPPGTAAGSPPGARR
jgi:diadenosine tetraphosphate (Ap4A) HIT family hydrolase